jgi:hypothetical protein
MLRQLIRQRRLHSVAPRALVFGVVLIFIAGVPISASGTASAPPIVSKRAGRPATQSVASPGEWTQDGHDANRSGYTPEEPFDPWTLAWTWNGPDATGGTGNHFYNAPAEARTVTGGLGVYVPAGAGGIYGLAKATGSPLWHVTATSFNATPAYDPATGALFAGGGDGNLYKIDALTGIVIKTYPAGSPINKSVLLVGSAAYVVTDSGQLHKVDMATMAPVWVYTANSPSATPPSYSSSRGLIVFATMDLYVHAVDNVAGGQRWGVKPSPNPAQFPYTFNRAWPVIAEQHGIVFLRMQLAHSFMSDFPGNGGIYPTTNAATRAYLQSHPDHQNLFALSLDDGSAKFVPAVGYGTTEDFINGAAYGVMGSQPVVKVWPDGSEVVYIHFRNGQTNPPDYRWDGNMGEMVLDSTTIPGLAAGDLRFVRMARRNDYGGTAYVDVVDEQEPLTVAGTTIFQAHWGASESVSITDRSSARGLSYASPIETSMHPSVIRQQAMCANKNTTTHWTTCGLTMYQDGRYWDGPGFWEYWNVVAPPGSPNPTGYSAGFLPRYTYVSDGMIVVEGNGGELFVLRHSAIAPPPPPIVSLTAPASGATVAGRSVTLSATVANPTGVRSLQFTLDGAAIGAARTNAPYSITWDSTKVGDGNHILGAQVKDAGGNVLRTTTEAITVSNTVRATAVPPPIPRPGNPLPGIPNPLPPPR